MRNPSKKSGLLTILLLTLMVLLPAISMAVPAAPDESIVFQPDGKRVRVHLRGDEWKNWEETADGYTVSRDVDGFWRYVLEFKDRKRPVFVPTRAHEKAPYGLRRHIQPDLAASDTGAVAATSESVPLSAPSGTFSGNILFILAEFSDHSGTYSESSWGDFISLNIADFFDASSYGQVSLSPAIESSGDPDNGVVGWVNLGYPHPDTGDSTGPDNRTLAENAIIAADPFIDYSSYDGNLDGYVDSDELAVVVIVAGFEKAYNPSYTPSVWGHKWSTLSVTTVDGVIVGDYHFDTGGYAQFGEIHNSHQATMGIMVHELGHLIFRLPDLYDTDGSSCGIGAWGVMSSGSWGKASSDSYSGETPVLPCAWVRYNRGWADGSEGSGTVSITGAGETAATGSNTVFRASTELTDEYFLVENRQPVGYDRGLERWLGTGFGGLTIWHVDEGQANNEDDDHRLVDLEEADGTQMAGSDYGSKTDLWYQGNSVLFNDASNPGSKLYDGSSSALSVGDISTSSVTMTAYFSLDPATPVPLPYSQDFSGGMPGLAYGWEYYSANSYGRIEVVSERLRMDVTSWGNYCLNEAVFALNLTGYSSVQLSFFQTEFDGETSLPDTFTGHYNGDGVAISDDGTTWYTILNASDLNVGSSGQTFNVDLDAEVASVQTTDPSFGYTSAFKIKFQQYDNRPYSSDGREWDNISVTGTGELFVTVPQAAAEGDGLLTGQGTVSILSPSSGDVIVNLSSDDVSEVTVAATATIPVGGTSALFDLTVEDDTDYDGVQTAAITAGATGFTPAADTIDVADNDVHHFDVSSIPIVQIAEVPFPVTLTAQDINDATVLPFAGDANLTGAGDGGAVTVVPSTTTAFTDGQWIGDVTVNAIDTNVSITADEGSGNTGTSNPFDVTAGPLDHFIFSIISSPQYVDIPFSTTLTARDANGYNAIDFSGTVQLSGNVATEPPSTPVLISPVETGNFVSGTWTGDVTVLEGAADMYLEADDGGGHTGMSGIFMVVPDTDGDGIYDDDEIDIYGTDPDDADSDDDGIDDGDELEYWAGSWDEDLDIDGLINILDDDSDGDGLSDGDEVNTHSTYPDDDDFDDDGWNDGDEVAAGTNPLDGNDHPPSIPTLNEWGMMVFFVLLIVVGAVTIRRRGSII